MPRQEQLRWTKKEEDGVKFDRMLTNILENENLDDRLQLCGRLNDNEMPDWWKTAPAEHDKNLLIGISRHGFRKEMNFHILSDPELPFLEAMKPVAEEIIKSVLDAAGFKLIKEEMRAIPETEKQKKITEEELKIVIENVNYFEHCVRIFGGNEAVRNLFLSPYENITINDQEGNECTSLVNLVKAATARLSIDTQLFGTQEAMVRRVDEVLTIYDFGEWLDAPNDTKPKYLCQELFRKTEIKAEKLEEELAKKDGENRELKGENRKLKEDYNKMFNALNGNIQHQIKIRNRCARPKPELRGWRKVFAKLYRRKSWLVAILVGSLFLDVLVILGLAAFLETFCSNMGINDGIELKHINDGKGNPRTKGLVTPRSTE